MSTVKRESLEEYTKNKNKIQLWKKLREHDNDGTEVKENVWWWKIEGWEKLMNNMMVSSKQSTFHYTTHKIGKSTLLAKKTNMLTDNCGKIELC